ncbi:hypothetical protein LEP1GSC161_2818 [Leptospira santarosai str. CBC1416]|uniref:Uncharacterized protein n=1 Tax=Leptospira santarosai str. CBC1416 TaxID=1193059 RepID=M6VV69_9LEPT|nr:hypothetical protein LEP1GSC039_0579 [Leptospira santarosai str. 2000027870]EMO59001.1 hypothetical protein LEP1GSC161_2818 [Leptospira santarosai str. CBC1416]
MSFLFAQILLHRTHVKLTFSFSQFSPICNFQNPYIFEHRL